MKLEVKNINKSFGDNHVLKDISFSAQSGKAFGLLGRNGSGKTTNIRIIMDVFKPDSGEVLFDGKIKSKTNFTFGYLPEERGLYPKRTIIDQMTYFGNLKGLNTKDAIANANSLLDRIGASEYTNKKLETLSKGNQQKIQLAISLIGDPDILILDEPFSGLDPVNAQLLKDMVRDEVNKKKIVLFSSHQMANVEEFCDDVCIINHGSIVLNGNLNEIKDSYPRNKILINPNSEFINPFKIFIEENSDLKHLITNVTEGRKGYIFTLKNEADKTNLLKLIQSQVEIDMFQVVKPSLEEIFVERAGDSVE